MKSKALCLSPVPCPRAERNSSFSFSTRGRGEDVMEGEDLFFFLLSLSLFLSLPSFLFTIFIFPIIFLVHMHTFFCMYQLNSLYSLMNVDFSLCPCAVQCCPLKSLFGTFHLQDTGVDDSRSSGCFETAG